MKVVRVGGEVSRTPGIVVGIGKNFLDIKFRFIDRRSFGVCFLRFFCCRTNKFLLSV